ncbi:MAG: class I SAM-dependent methyltransferase [Acidobacteria bacterium]|nr:MAG: class I SAM-dependent methyltransferase [Acidobacteriota bacterium]
MKLDEFKAEFWERTDYDRAFRGSFGRYMTEIERAALERVMGDLRAPVLLDLGCGHGRFLRWLAPRAGRLVGLDRSGRLLGVASESLARQPLGIPAALLRASATAIPLADASIDAVTCVRVIQHIPQQDLVLHEIRRVLRPGGTLVLVQYNWASPHGLVRAVKLPVKAALRSLLRRLGRQPRFDERTRWTCWPLLKRQLHRAGFGIDAATGAWIFPLQYFRRRRSNDAFRPFLRLALAAEKLADRTPFRFAGGYLVVRCRARGAPAARLGRKPRGGSALSR